MAYGSIRIVAAPEDSPPFDVEAITLEEDTWLIMSADPEACELEENPIRLMTELIETRPEPVGSVKTIAGKPIRFYAIVHDVDQEPIWREEWVESALKELFLKAEQQKLHSIGLPLLGTSYGKLGTERFVVLLGRALKQTNFNHLKRLWLVTPPRIGFKVIESLEALVDET